MAQELIGPQTVPAGPFDMGNNVRCDRVAAVIERDPSPPNNPYIAIMLSVQAVGQNVNLTAQQGKLRIVVHYDDRTQTELTMSDDPFGTGYTIPVAQQGWVIVRRDGKCYQEATPSAGLVFAMGSTPETQEQHPLTASKVATALDYYWTDD